jgi:hypothetical protein
MIIKYIYFGMLKIFSQSFYFNYSKMELRRVRSKSDCDFFFERNLVEIHKVQISKINCSLEDDKKFLKRTSLIRSLKIRTDHQKSYLFFYSRL